LSAVGHEVNCAGEVGDADYKGWEIDFEREVAFRRYWNDALVDITDEGVSAITISDLSGTVVELVVTVEASSTEGAGSIVLELIAPSGNSIVLSDRRDGDGGANDFYYTSFSDSGVASVTDTEVIDFQTLLIPEESLSELDGESINGEWQLKLTGSGGSSAIDYFGLSVR
jgi:subtilisin-like proprotein convertase family protein